MQHRMLKQCAIALSASMALVTSPSRALIENEPVLPPAGGWGYEGGTSYGEGLADTVELPHVTVTGKREDRTTTLFAVNVPFTGLVPTPTLSSDAGPPDSTKQKACVDSCDQKQKIGKDLCDVAAAKASASGTVTAIGIGFSVGALLTWKGTIAIGAPAGFGAYLVANQLAKDNAATINLACIGKVAQDHASCLTGVCKVSG